MLAELSAGRRQLRFILVLMLVGGVAEMMSLGAALAFLALLSSSVIAHRLSTLSKCDRVVRLAAGTIIEVGSYREMVSSPAASEASRQSLTQDLGG